MSEQERLEAILQRISDIRAQQDALSHQLKQLQWEYNSSQPVARLPDELLVEIFVLSEFSRLMMSVCKRWRNLIVSTPLFWRNIDVTPIGSPRWLNLCLFRSEPARCLNVTSHLDNPFSGAHSPYLAPHIPRMRRIVLKSHPSTWSEDPLARFQQPSPVLEVLEFLPSGLGERHVPMDLRLTAKRFPRLRHIHLTQLVTPTDAGLYNNLHTLCLRECKFEGSFDDCTRLLMASPALRILSLTSFLSQFSADSVVYPPSTYQPTLRLTKLELYNEAAPHISCFTTYTGLPCSELVLHSKETSVIGTKIADLLPRNFAATSLQDCLANATEVSLEMDYAGRLSISGHHPDYDTTSVRLAIFPVEWDQSHPLDDGLIALNHLMGGFPRHNIKRLYVKGSHSSVDRHIWEDVFTTLTKLEAIYLVDLSPSASQSFWEGLRAVSQRTGKTSLGEPTVCPLLHKMVSVDSDSNDAVMQAALQCLEYRKSRGTAISHLEMVYEVDYQFWDDITEASCLAGRYLPLLQALVEALVFEDRYGEALPYSEDVKRRLRRESSSGDLW